LLIQLDATHHTWTFLKIELGHHLILIMIPKIELSIQIEKSWFKSL